jgi:tRNA threonylcarbamoyl adenosine modification protein YeaZ
MNFLSIDCSTDIGSLFIKTENKTFSKVLQSDKFNNDLLMKQILHFLDKCNLNIDDISKIYINQGPGNFSGLRGSLSIAKGISISKNLKLFGYNTFIWASVKFFQKSDFIYSIIKFREKYFIKKFNSNLDKASKAVEVSKEEIVKKYANKFKVIPKNLVQQIDKKILKLNNVTIANLDHNELEFLELKGLLNEDLIKPLYLS